MKHAQLLLNHGRGDGDAFVEEDDALRVRVRARQLAYTTASHLRAELRERLRGAVVAEVGTTHLALEPARSGVQLDRARQRAAPRWRRLCARAVAHGVISTGETAEELSPRT